MHDRISFSHPFIITYGDTLDFYTPENGGFKGTTHSDKIYPPAT